MKCTEEILILSTLSRKDVEKRISKYDDIFLKHIITSYKNSIIFDIFLMNIKKECILLGIIDLI